MSNHIFWLKTSLLFLLRSGRSTFVLSLMVTASVAALVFLSAMAVGVNDAMVRNSVSLYSGHISGSVNEGFEADAFETQGVKAVLARRHQPGLLFKDGKAEPLMVIGVDPAAELKNTALWKKTVEGGYIEDGETIYISASIAERLGVKPGDSVRFSYGGNGMINLKVSGVFKTGVDMLDRGAAFVPDQILRQEGLKTEAAVFLEDGYEPSSILEGYRSKGLDAGSLKPWHELMPDLKELIELNYVSMTIVMVIVFFVVAIGIGSAFSIFILKHMREYGIMKSMGVTSGEMTFFIISEVVLMDIIASLIGAALGAIASLIAGNAGIDLGAFTSHNRYFSVSGMVYPRLTFYSLVLPLLLSLIFGVMASLWPALILARRKAADILRMI